MTQTFQVDLRGLVDLLARHLYSSPRVFVRELLQNAVDAVVARRELGESPAAKVVLRCHEIDHRPVLDVLDNGIGLTADQAGELLATIGRSSKRDVDLGLGRAEYIGQFGIGMLAAFMVSAEIEVISVSAASDAPPVRWCGRDDGTFEIGEIAPDDPALEGLEAGTRVRLWARRDAEHWFTPEAITALATEFGQLLPIDVAVVVPVGDLELPRRITQPELPWQVKHASAAARAKAMREYCEQAFGFTPLGHIDLSVPLAGVSGIAFILPAAVSPTSGQHRVYVKQMLLGERVSGVLPEWAFFVRAVINADGLSPTASREQLHSDEVLIATQEALGDQLKAWAVANLATPGPAARTIITTHHLALRALAITDEAMLDLGAQVLPFETTDGPMTLAEVRERAGEVVFTATTESYQRVATVARAEGLTVVNGGYVYDGDLLSRLASRPGWQVRELGTQDLVQVLTPLEPHRELEVLDAVAVARQALTQEECDVLVRTFSPEAVPAILLRDRDGEHQRDLAREHAQANDVWGEVLGNFITENPARRRLVLNDASALVRQLLAAGSGDVFEAGVRALYLAAVMLAGDGLAGREIESLNGALSVLLDAGLKGESS